MNGEDNYIYHRPDRLHRYARHLGLYILPMKRLIPRSRARRVELNISIILPVLFAVATALAYDVIVPPPMLLKGRERGRRRETGEIQVSQLGEMKIGS